jgi:hypothetical protein
MEQKIFHGPIQPEDIARSLMAHFNRGNFRVQQFGSGDELAVQIATSQVIASGGQTALSVTLQKVEDGVAVTIGQQAWFGVAASLGTTAFTALRNPLNLLSRLDDLAQDIESLQLRDEVWHEVELTANALGSGYELSNRLKRYVCSYCSTANPPGEPRCIACGAPLGDVQLRTCKNCGFILRNNEKFCPNCKKPVT